MAVCTRCGAHNGDEARFCAQCGNALAPDAAPAPVPPPPAPASPPPQSYWQPPHDRQPPAQFAQPPSRGTNWLLYGCVGCAVFALLIVALVIAAGWFAAKTFGNAIGGNGARVSGPANAPHTTLAYGGRSLTAVDIENVVYAVTSVQFASTVGGTSTTSTHVDPAHAHGRYVILRLLAVDRAQRAEVVMLGRSVLIDPAGNQYPVSAEGQAAMVATGDPEAMGFFNAVEPGIDRLFRIVFDVPSDRKRFTLRIRHGMFSHGDDGTLPVVP